MGGWKKKEKGKERGDKIFVRSEKKMFWALLGGKKELRRERKGERKFRGLLGGKKKKKERKRERKFLGSSGWKKKKKERKGERKFSREARKKIFGVSWVEKKRKRKGKERKGEKKFWGGPGKKKKKKKKKKS